MPLSIAEINPKVEINSLAATGPFGLPLLSVKFLKTMGQGGHTLAYKAGEDFIMCYDQQPEALKRWAAEHEPHDQFFLVANLKPGAKKRTKSDILSTDWLWVDIDPKEGEPNDGDERLKAFSPQPTIITNSGNGFHGFWKLDKPLDVAKDEGALLSSYLRELATQLGGDMAVTDAPRMLRLPGSINHKKVDGKPSRKLTGIVREEGDGIIYSIDAFARHTEGGEGPKEVSVKKLSSLKKMVKVLNSIPLKESGDREIWRKLGTSLKSAYPGDDGFAVFNEWSFKDGKNYGGPAATRKEWDGFKEENTDPNYLMSFGKRSRDGYEMKFGKIDPLEVVNVEKAIRDIGVVCRSNLWSDKTVIKADTKEWLAPEPRLKKEMQISDLACKWMAKQIKKTVGFSPSIANVSLAADNNSFENKFDPVVDETRLENWDKEERLETWMIDYLHVEDTPVNREVSSIFIRGMVQRAHKPGAKMDGMPVFIGDPGCRKSSMLKVLANGFEEREGEGYFTDNVNTHELYDADRKALEGTEGAWVVEFPEMRGAKSSMNGALKVYITRTFDKARKSHQRETISVPRRFVLAGTTNDMVFLNDPTGSRRFWPVVIPSGTLIDTEGVGRVRLQLFAEALVKINQSLDMTDEGKEAIKALGQQSYNMPALEELVRENFSDHKLLEQVTLEDLKKLGDWYGIPYIGNKEFEYTVLNVLPLLGFTKMKTTNKKETERRRELAKAGLEVPMEGREPLRPYIWTKTK